MVRLKHVKSGAVVQVTEEKAVRLGSEWKVIPEPKPKVESKKS